MRAIPAIVRHQFDAKSERVTLQVRPKVAGLSEAYELTISEARRLAWGILADVSPDEIDLDDEQAKADAAAERAFAGDCDCGRSRTRRPTGKAGVILEALAFGPMTAHEAGELIERSTSIASSFIVQLVRLDLVDRESGGLFGEPTVYAITARGRVALGGGGR